MQLVSAQMESFPKTRYLGSKRKLFGLLSGVFGNLEFDRALDPFSGTGAVAYLLKTLGKEVTASDFLESNVAAARALVANSDASLGPIADELLRDLPDRTAQAGFIEQTFAGVFFEPEENRFLDNILPRIHALCGPQRDLALYALFQSSLAKRPYNLFHRANLNMRRRDVTRSFGNKTTWDRPFAELFCRHSREADRAVFDSGRHCRAIRSDVLEIEPRDYDLVYLDPPYISSRGASVDYLDYYHFLEGLCLPDSTAWEKLILHRYKHKPLRGRGLSPWCDPNRIGQVFAETIDRFSGSTLVISYRSDGIPTIDDIASFVRRAGKSCEIIDGGKYTYALSRNRRSHEVVLIGR